jgi:hypothetical protein
LTDASHKKRTGEGTAPSCHGESMMKPVVAIIEHGSNKDAVKAKLDASLGDIRARLGTHWSGRSSSR